MHVLKEYVNSIEKAAYKTLSSRLLKKTHTTQHSQMNGAEWEAQKKMKTRVKQNSSSMLNIKTWT